MPEDKLVTESAPQTPTPAAEAPQASQVESKGGGDGVPPLTDTKAPQQGETTEYTPNFKFKVMDQEKEFDEWIRPLVKDPETEKRARELMERAYGQEFTKTRYEETKQFLEELYPKHQEMSQAVNEVLYARDNKDYDALFQHLNIPEQELAKWMLEKINRQNLPPEQKQVYDGYDTARREKSQLERRLQMLEQNLSQQHTRARANELNQVLSSPDVAQVVKDYDARAGKPGAFRDTVIKFARAEWLSTNTDLTAEQAVQQVMAILPPGQTGQSAPTQEKPLPVIPRTTGKAVSATNKIPSSIDDLKKMAKAMSQ